MVASEDSSDHFASKKKRQARLILFQVQPFSGKHPDYKICNKDLGTIQQGLEAGLHLLVDKRRG